MHRRLLYTIATVVAALGLFTVAAGIAVAAMQRRDTALTMGHENRSEGAEQGKTFAK